jgi:hypothetical protein
MSDNPCAALSALKDAQLQLLAGQTVAAVAFGDQTIHFSRANATELRLLISRLSAECDRNRGRKGAVRVGPSARWTAASRLWGY